jgi:virginiamycin B lyase
LEVVLIKHPERLIAFAVVFTAAACERAALPTATMEGTGPLFAAGPAGHFKSFRVPTDNSNPRHITLGSDGNMWFTESNIDVSQIGRIDADGNITEFVVPTRFSQPSDIVSGPDGALWFTAPSGWPDMFIGRVTTDGQFKGFTPCTDFCSISPGGIASGPDGNIWFTERIRNAIVKLTPSGEFTFYTIPTPDATPAGITAGPDGALWFAEFHGHKIGRITTDGLITESATTIGPSRITLGPDGNLWFTAPFENKIGRLDPLTGVITEFSLTPPSQPRDIVAGPDGNLWFTEYNAGQLSQVTPDGVVTPVQRVRGGTWGIGRGADGAIWLTQIDGNKVARFTPR